MSLIDPSAILALLLMVLSGGVRDLASCISTDYYWKAKNVTVSVEQLTHELEATPAADVSKVIADLDADDPKARDEATAKIAALGPAAIPGLEEAAKNGSPEIIARAKGLLAKIRAQSKEASVRRLMAIRTLGEMKNASALPTLRRLLDSKELFEAEYARAAIAKIEGKDYTLPVATEASRAADLALLPSKLDAVAQVAPQVNGAFSIETMMAQLPMDQEQKNKSRDEANSQILKVLDQVGNIQLDSLTWGFYAAPPGQPGNTMAIARGIFDPTALADLLGKSIPKSKKMEGMDVFELDQDSALIIAPTGRVVFLSREPTGDLALDTMISALKKGTGDFAANPDLPPLVKAMDTKAPLWAAARLGTGMKEIVGPLGDFDTATLVADQSIDHDKVTTSIHLKAQSTDAAKAKQAVETVRAELKTAVEQGRQEEKQMPFIKPMIDFVESIKLDSDGGNATVDGSMVGSPTTPMLMMYGTVAATRVQVAPAPQGQPAPRPIR